MYKFVILEKSKDFPGGYYYIDLDKTLAYHKTEWGADVIGKPLPKMLKKLKGLLRNGKKIKIFTARATDKKAVKEIQAWLKENKLPRFEVTNIKGTDVIEIWDDRARQVDPNTGEFTKAQGGYGGSRVPLIGLGLPGSGQFRSHKLGRSERKRLAKRKRIERKKERKEDIEAYGEALD